MSDVSVGRFWFKSKWRHKCIETIHLKKSTGTASIQWKTRNSCDKAKAAIPGMIRKMEKVNKACKETISYDQLFKKVGLKIWLWSSSYLQKEVNDFLEDEIVAHLNLPSDSSRERVIALLEKNLELYFMDAVLESVRRAWLPTTGAGSQEENFKRHAEILDRISAVLKTL